MEYLEAITELVARVGLAQAENVRRAAELLTASLRKGGVVQAFGSGHAEAIAMEVAGRAGGLVPANRIALRDLVFYGGEPFSVLEDQLLERREGVAKRLYGLAPVSKEDVFVLASNSGINGVVVELALLVKERGHDLIAITSLDHSLHSEPRHASGKRLCEIADIVLDNGAPYGDVLLPNHTGGVSTVTGTMLAQMVMTEVVRRMELAGETAPIYLSANIAGGYEHNELLEARYAGRIRRTA
jgi:uncharacterized phosphosugar-binding protein